MRLMNLEITNGYLTLELLSDIELYYSSQVTDENISITGDEVNHITRVMRHRIGDELHVTDGNGYIYKGKLKSISKYEVVLEVLSKEFNENNFGNIFFCLPKLKSQERLEFAVEKCIELGISNFIFFPTERTIKSSIKLTRLEKIALSAMKQSLHTCKPILTEINSFEELLNIEGEFIILEQKSKNKLTELILNKNNNYYFMFGPEGGFSNNEFQKVSNKQQYTMNTNRLRSETAAVCCASILQTLI